MVLMRSYLVVEEPLYKVLTNESLMLDIESKLSGPDVYAALAESSLGNLGQIYFLLHYVNISFIFDKLIE
jgi:hypothetical protein